MQNPKLARLRGGLSRKLRIREAPNVCNYNVVLVEKFSSQTRSNRAENLGNQPTSFFSARAHFPDRRSANDPPTPGFAGARDLRNIPRVHHFECKSEALPKPYGEYRVKLVPRYFCLVSGGDNAPLP